MANAKVVRSGLGRPRAVTGSKGKSRRRTVSVRPDPKRLPPELHPLMTREIEDQLRKLVAKFGDEKVREALDPLITKCKWNDWQCVANAIRRIARENERRRELRNH